jgi:hypothetical protein
VPQYSQAVRDEKTQEAVELRAKQWSWNRIGQEIGVAHHTAKKWVEDEHARRAEHRGVDKEAHLAVYDAVQKAAWEAFHDTHAGSLNRSGYLNTIKAAEDSKAKITGAEAPLKFQHIDEEYDVVFGEEPLDASSLQAES